MCDWRVSKAGENRWGDKGSSSRWSCLMRKDSDKEEDLMQTIEGEGFLCLTREGGIPEEDAHLKAYDLPFRFPFPLCALPISTEMEMVAEWVFQRRSFGEEGHTPWSSSVQDGTSRNVPPGTGDQLQAAVTARDCQGGCLRPSSKATKWSFKIWFFWH